MLLTSNSANRYHITLFHPPNMFSLLYFLVFFIVLIIVFLNKILLDIPYCVNVPYDSMNLFDRYVLLNRDLIDNGSFSALDKVIIGCMIIGFALNRDNLPLDELGYNLLSFNLVLYILCDKYEFITQVQQAILRIQTHVTCHLRDFWAKPTCLDVSSKL